MCDYGVEADNANVADVGAADGDDDNTAVHDDDLLTTKAWLSAA